MLQILNFNDFTVNYRRGNMVFVLKNTDSSEILLMDYEE